MKRMIALVIGLAMMAATPGVAMADPISRPAGHQQAVDAVIARALAQRGVPYTYGGGDATGPTRRPASVPTPAPDVVPLDQTTPGLGLTPVPGLAAPSIAAPDATANVVGFDASGLIVYAFAGVGLKLPRSSGEQYKVGWKVAPDQALPGDLIFYGPDGTQSVAMFLGNGQMLEATTPAVKVSPVRTNGMAPYLSRIIS
ncbi:MULTISPECIES: NlpC/P60 family peptidoglycan-binding protein RipD [unclassified Mycobacterium]|uniref:NlpC/P60 family peptidoglycan-binding protein RipD n=1 Tax=unclassified Mycobacterium TaxID=2642494 RepID=UPI0029C6DF7F|nr:MULTISPECIES: NlpC/P60 family peptidoglycan-binding protein RipD [unclassified Mycobacterium]